MVLILSFIIAFQPLYGMKRVSRMLPLMRNYSTKTVNYLNSMRQLRMNKLDAVKRLRTQHKAFDHLNYLARGKSSYEEGTDLALITDKAFPSKEEIDHYQEELFNEPVYFSATKNEEFCVRSGLSDGELTKQLNKLQKRMKGPRFGWQNMLQLSQGLVVPFATTYLADLCDIGITHPLAYLGTAAAAVTYGLVATCFGIKNGITRWTFLKSDAGKELAQLLEEKKKEYTEEKNERDLVKNSNNIQKRT